MASFSPAGLQRGRRSFYVFNSLNSVSFVLLSGSFVTLYALSLGASNATIGLLNAFGYGTFFFLPLGKRLVRERSILKVFGLAWFWRFIAILPALIAPIFVAQGMSGVGFALILIGVALFNMLRGVGLIGNNPVLANLAAGGAKGKRTDRGAFLVNVQIVASLAGMGTNLLVALMIGPSAPPWAFAAAMGVGVAVGIIGSLVLLKYVPEPEGYRPERSGSLMKSAREAYKEKPFRVFMETLFLLSLVAGMARSFLPVYAKDVFSQGDDVVMAYSLVASVGSLAMGLLTRLLVDRLGAKPLYVVFAAVTFLSIAPLAIVPGATGVLALPISAAILLGLVNFFSSFGLAGEENAGQTYFFSLVSAERTLDLGVIYFLVYGLGGTIGSGAGGLALDALGAVGLSHALAFRIFFAVLLLVLVWVLARMGALVRLGSVSVRESIGVMLSIRDLRAFNLLSRLDKSSDPAEEIALIRGIGAGASGAAQAGLLAYLGSPRFDVRLEALLAIENMGALGGRAVEALAEEVERQPYTTAYLAARILGKTASEEPARRARVLAALRLAMAAQDYMLQASAMVALARLGDRESVAAIEDILASSRIPRVRISAAYALELLGSRASLPVLVSCLRRERDPAFVSDELLLSTAAIAGVMPRFYGLYQAFMEDEATGLFALSDSADAALGANTGIAFGEIASSLRSAFSAALALLLAEPCDGAPMGRLILARGPDEAGDPWLTDLVLSEAALDPGPGYRGFRFFISAYFLLRTK